MSELEPGVDDCFLALRDSAITVPEGDVVDKSPGVGGRENEAHLDNVAMNHIGPILRQSVRVDGHRVDVAVREEILDVLGSIGLVQITVGVDTIITVLKKGVTENIVRLVVRVLPDERDLTTVVVLEGVVSNNTAIGALQVVLRGVATEVVVVCHFDYSSFPQ